VFNKYKYYHIEDLPKTKKAKKPFTKLVLFTFVFALLITGYIFALLYSPKILTKPALAEADQSKLINDNQDFIKIENLKILTPIGGDASGRAGEGVWYNSELGNDPANGNYVLTGYKLVLGLTPKDVTNKSKLYNLDSIKKNEKIVLYSNGSWRTFLVDTVQKGNIQPKKINSIPGQKKLVIYSCVVSCRVNVNLAIEAKPEFTESSSDSSNNPLL
jgi:hypothetical protein